MQKFDLGYCTVQYKEPIVYFTFREGAELGFPKMRECVAIAERLSEKQPYFTFASVRQNVNFTIERRKVAAEAGRH